MTGLRNKNFIKIILSKAPIILLFVSVLNDFDFNHLSLKYFSFNFSYRRNQTPLISHPLRGPPR